MYDNTLSLRPISAADHSFLESLYASTRASEMLQLDSWSDAQKQAFLQMQFSAQHQHYQQHYSGAAFDVVELAGEPVGRLYVHRQPHDIRIIEISFLPEHRHKGYGTRLLQALMAEVTAQNAQLSIHLADNNDLARQFYLQLGFVEVSENTEPAFYRHMVWRSAADQQTVKQLKTAAHSQVF